MNEFIETMIRRRTIRKYKPEQIRESELKDIIEAGLHAPSAGGRQSAIIVACQNTELNEEIGRLSRQAETLNNVNMGRVSTEQPSIVDDSSIKSGFYGAPTVITIFAPKDNYNLTGDCFVVAENIALAAQSLNIGSCIVGRAYKIFDTKRGREIQKTWGIEDNYEARVHITLGYIDGEAPKYKPRKDGRIVRV